jgi:diguanylate cyclase (GGDEF)-like protein
VLSSLSLYVAAVTVLGLLSLAAVVASTPLHWLRDDPAVFLVLAVLLFLGELRPITVTRGDTRDEITISTTFALALILIGPLALAVAVQGLAVLCEDLRTRRPLPRVAFGIAQYALTLCAARGTFVLLTGDPFLRGSVLPAAAGPAGRPGGCGRLPRRQQRAGRHRRCPGGRRTGAPAPGHRRTLPAGHVRRAAVLRAGDRCRGARDAVAGPAAPAAHRGDPQDAKLAADREREALHDTLTGLPNRTLLRMRMDRALDEQERGRTRLRVLLVDLDHFKEINDTLGHHVGDELLVEVARRIAGNLRPGDTVARLGGDEFAVLAELDAVGDGMKVADRLLQALEEPFTADSVRLDVQASMGLALHPQHGADGDTLLQRADVALYDAKTERGTVRLYEPAADDHTPERLVLATELRDGLQADELFLEFQPQVSALSGRVVGLEALVRWQHPRHGLLMPDDFLPVVENTGLIAPLTMAVLDKALEALAGWRAAGHDVSVAVNLSVRHLTDLELPRQVETLLRGRRIPPSALVLEVTETVIMSDPGRAVAVLTLLRDLGISVAIDDFGTGYSSLAYLRRLQIDELKIDKSFVLDLVNDEGDAVIVRSTIEMGHNLGLRVVAEGVEDDASLQLLRSWKCDVVQGYGISRPLAQDRVLGWLEARAGELTAFSDRWIAAALAAARNEAGIVGVSAPLTALQQRGEQAC